MEKKTIGLDINIDGRDYCLEMEAFDDETYGLLVVIPQYISSQGDQLGKAGSPFFDGAILSEFSTPKEFLDDAHHMTTRSTDGIGVLAVEEHLNEHGRIFEQDIDSLLNTYLHFLLVLAKAAGEYNDCFRETFLPDGHAMKQKMIRQAGSLYISSTDPRWLEYVRQQGT